MVFIELNDTLECVLCLMSFPCRTGHHQLAGLPNIVMVVFNNGYIKFLMESRQDGFDATPFRFKGVAFREIDG